MNNVYETLSFGGNTNSCYGMEIVKYWLKIYNNTVLPFDYNSKNKVLVSLYWIEQLFDFIKFRYDKRLAGREIIVGGNYPSTSPQSLLPFDCSIFLGDGEKFANESDKHIITIKTREAKIKATVEQIIPIGYFDLQSNMREFCEISRGCKNKCCFCQYGWLKKYQEASIDDIKEVIKRSKTKSVRIFAADRYEHTHYNLIRKFMDKIGKNDTGSDVTLQNLLKNPELLKITNKIRTGIEGVSERLRRLVLKNTTNQEIIDFFKLISQNGFNTVDIYMIYGLPGEKPEELEEFRELLMQLDEMLPSNFLLAIHWNAFTPSAQTPLQWAAPAFLNIGHYKKFFDNIGNKKIRIYCKPKLTSEWTIIKRMLAIRGSEASKILLYNVAFNENKLKKNIDFVLKEFERCEGYNLLDKLDINKPLPWDRYCIYNKEKMLKVYQWFLRNRCLGKYAA